MDDLLFSNFIGPGAENIDTLRNLLNKVIDFHEGWRKSYYQEDDTLFPPSILDTKSFEKELEIFLERSKKNLPYFHPRYVAQMLKDPTIPTILGYLTFMMSNPNNHAYEGGPVTTEMEMEVTDLLKRFVGYNADGWGHLTSGGSLANLEALWAARDTYGQGKVLFSEVSHYSWKRICKILSIPDYKEISVDSNFRINLNALEDELKKENTLMVVANLGSTGSGSVDDIEGILSLRKKYNFHLHIDAAYGGFFRSLILDSDYKIIPGFQTVPEEYLYRQLIALQEADSLTIDPHKHGAVSYGAGAVLYRNMELQQALLNTAPYTYHKTDKPNIGMFSLEGSRPGAMAAATYLTFRALPPHFHGLGKLVNSSYLSARHLYEEIEKTQDFANLSKPDLDINCFFNRPGKKDITELNTKSLKLYNRLSVENAKPEFILSKFVISPEIAKTVLSDYINSQNENLISLRTVNIKHWGSLDNFRYIDLLVKELEIIANN